MSLSPMPTDFSSPYMWRSACYEALIAGAINDYSSAIEMLPEDSRPYQYRGYL